jgi:hypothetical protein
MKKKCMQGLRRFPVEVRFWGSYVEQLDELEQALARKPRALQIELVGSGELPADVALQFRSVLMNRSPTTRIVTHARSGLQGGSVLLWLLGETRTMRDDARIYFRPTTFSEDHEVSETDSGVKGEPAYQDSYSEVDPAEADYARVLELINEFLPVREMAGRVIGVRVLRQFGLIENEKADRFLATVFSKSPSRAREVLSSKDRPRGQRRGKTRARQMRK